MPVVIVYRQVSFEELVSFYAAANVCVISSLRDRMNLVLHEYVANVSHSEGMLILLESTGAAQILTESMIINPPATRGIRHHVPQSSDHGRGGAGAEMEDNASASSEEQQRCLGQSMHFPAREGSVLNPNTNEPGRNRREWEK